MNDRVEPASAQAAPPMVRAFRQILLYPVQLIRRAGQNPSSANWERLLVPDSVWRESTADPAALSPAYRERHYAEFVAFMPDVQRFLYGEGSGGAGSAGTIAPALHIFRRHDIVAARVILRPGARVIEFAVPRVELVFFHDVDLAMLVVEVAATDLTLAEAQETLFRLGRAFPASWDEAGNGVHCCTAIELLDCEGRLLEVSDFADKERYVAAVCDHRVSDVAAHWAFMLAPLAPEHRPGRAGISYCLLEQERMPLLAHLAIDDPQRISRDDWVRLGLAAAPGRPGSAPFGAAYLDDFEARFCYDRFWDTGRSHDCTATRMICSGHAFLMVGDAANSRFTDAERGILAKFDHQYFLLALIAHFHRAALMTFRDRLVSAMSLLSDYAPETVKAFKREIRLTHENFLRFTHRYWFSEVSTQGPAHDIFARWIDLLGTERLFAEVREEVNDMMDYLDSDGLRRQANSVVRLTVVTFFGLIGTVATGFLGMNLIDLTQIPLLDKTLYLIAVLIPVAFLTFYTAAKSQRLSEFLEVVSDPRMTLRLKLLALARVWRRG